MFPIMITFPETLMNSWSFRGFQLDYRPSDEISLRPKIGAGYYTDSSGEEKFYPSPEREWIYNNYFNDSDKAFADANPLWNMVADVTISSLYMGYTWGVFLPVYTFRFMKLGWGFGITYSDLSYKLSLCTQYISETIVKNDELIIDDTGICENKTEIDVASGHINAYAFPVQNATLFERVTEDSIWRIGHIEWFGVPGNQTDQSLKLKNHDDLFEILSLDSQTTEVISYTYRF